MNYQDILTPEFIDEIVRKEMEYTADLNERFPTELQESEEIIEAAKVIHKYYGG